MKTKAAETADQSKPNHHRLESRLWAALFLGVFLYIWWGIGPHLLYYGFGVFSVYPGFSLDSTFIRTTLSSAGGTINALAVLLAQTYQVAWLGALLVTVVLGALFVGIRRLLTSARAGKFGDLAWFPVLLALPIYSYYYEDPLPALLSVTLAVWTAILYVAVPVKTLAGRVGLFAALFFAAYYLAGASALIFAAATCLVEALWRRNVIVALVQAALAAGGALVVGRFLFGLDPYAIYTVGTPWDPSNTSALSPLANWLALVLHVWVPVLVLLALLGQILLESEVQKAPQPSGRNRRHEPRGKSKPVARWLDDARLAIGLRILLVIVVTVPCLMLSRTYKRNERALHYYALQGRWDQVLALAQRMQRTNSFTRCGVFDINRALAHQGRLGSELCAFPQDDVGMLFMNFQDMSPRLLHAMSLDLYLDLGCLNAAQKNAYELLDLMGPSPHVLDVLIRIHLAKGQYESAKVIFGAMKKYVGCGAYVRRWQSVMADPALVESDPLIQSYRKVRPVADGTSMEISLPMLEKLLEDVPDHRLAFEYLMAGYLLRHERVELIAHLPMLRSLGYQQLPRHCAEALLVHSLETGAPANAQGWTVDPNLQRQFHDIRSIVTRAGGINQSAFDTLAPRYGDTYMFYSMFNQCGLKQP